MIYYNIAKQILKEENINEITLCQNSPFGEVNMTLRGDLMINELSSWLSKFDKWKAQDLFIALKKSEGKP